MSKQTKAGKFFFWLHRFNAIAILLIVLMAAFQIGYVILPELAYSNSYGDQRSGDGFGYKSEELNKLIGQGIETSDGLIAAYYEEGKDGERDDMGGVTLVNSRTGKDVEIGKGIEKSVVNFELIYDQGKGAGTVIGYLALITNDEQYAIGRADLVIGALPLMSRTVVAENILFADMPKVRGNGALGVVIWPEQDEAKMIGVDMKTGAIIDSADISLPPLKKNELSQGPGVADNPYLRRTPNLGAAPRNVFAF